ncbi:MAG: NAD(P)H-dependent oxidoreductase [Chitinophagaceae bacterium]|nr:NAD(P)H-dependent oxidoreductase [Chitinophagaceae bacterium]
MFHIAIVSCSVRIGRESHKVAKYFEKYITENNLASTEILDLKVYNFPVEEERLMYATTLTPEAKQFSEKIIAANAVIFVTPEYNGGYPASTKNAIDLLVKEWYHKPIGIATVSSGNFGGVNCMALLQTIFLKIKAVPVTATFPVPMVQDNFNEEGEPKDKPGTDKRAAAFIKELLWFTEAFSKMQ